jgi:hypothetical protein
MTRRLVTALAASAALLALSVAAVAAHGGEAGSGISVEPMQVTAGGTVVLAGQGLEPDTERQINLVGPDVVVPFAPVTTDADGMFSVTLTIPNHLPGGTYTLQAIGDETLTVDLAVTAVAGGSAAEPKNEVNAIVTPRDRSPLEFAAWTALILVALAVGAVLVIRAEPVGRAFARPGPVDTQE